MKGIKASLMVTTIFLALFIVQSYASTVSLNHIRPIKFNEPFSGTFETPTASQRPTVVSKRALIIGIADY